MITADKTRQFLLIFIVAFVAASVTACAEKHKRPTISKETLGENPIYGNWCGPAHPKYSADQSPPEPIDGLDAACKRHDQCYAKEGYRNCRCDTDFLQALEKGGFRTPIARTFYDYFALSPCTGSGGLKKPFKFVGRAVDDIVEAGPAYFIVKPIQLFGSAVTAIWNYSGYAAEQDTKRQAEWDAALIRREEEKRRQAERRERVAQTGNAAHKVGANLTYNDILGNGLSRCFR